MADFNQFYNPYGFQTRQNMQIVPQQPQQNNYYAFVNGIEGAKAYQVMPNQSVMLMDSDNPIAYMKEANAMGQSTLRYFKLVETSERELRGEQFNGNQQPNYALKTDLESLNKKLDNLSKEFKKLKKTANNEELEGDEENA